MMPPKKSKAARAATEEDSTVNVEKEVKEIKEKEAKKEESGEESEREEVNIFNTEIVFGKRHRVTPSGQQKLHDWIEIHLESNEEVHLHPNDVYSVYLEGCISSNTSGVELLTFVKEVKVKFPKGFSFRSDSPLHGSVKERKKRKTSVKTARAQSDATKLRDVMPPLFEDAGNPRKGLRFNMIKKLLMAKHPALQLDARPVILKNALNRALYFGHVRLVKGIGCAGFYRWVVKGEKEESEEEEDEKKKKKKKKGKEENGEENGVSSSDAKTDEEGDKEEKKEEGEEEEKKSEEEKKKKKKKKSKKIRVSYKQVVHSEPEKIVDTFQMAMTFMSDPKMASVTRIKKYILDHYHKDVGVEELREALQSGVDQGSWGQVTGASTTSGSYQLLLEDFDPLEDDDLEGKITNAIMASHEPKHSSFGLLKRYVSKYHPTFKVEERPSRLKKALEKALEQGIIRRLTGIGCSGTFQLAKAFVPSPAILAGNDTASDYDAESDFSDVELNGESRGVKGYQVSDFQDAYKPRPTKRHSRQAAKGRSKVTEVKLEPRARPVKSPIRPKTTKKQPKYVESSDDELDVEILPKKKRTPAKRKAVPVAKKGAKVAKKAKGKKAKSPAKKTPAKKTPAKKFYAESSDEEEEEEEEVTPIKKSAKKNKKSPPKRTPVKKYVESSDEEEKEEEEEVVARVPTKAARKAVPKKGAKRKADTGRASPRKSVISYAEESDEEEPENKNKKKKKKKSK